jgi:hypothetical protein
LNKIPVGATIAYAYGFTFGHLGVIIGLIWLPTVLSAVGSFFAQTFYYQDLLVAQTEGRSVAAGPGLASLLAWMIVAVLLGAIANVAVLQQAMGKRKGSPYYHFALGAEEFRVFGAQIALYATIIFLLLGMLIACTGLFETAAAGGSAAALAGPALLLAVIAGGVFILFVYARLGFLLLPATLIEEKIGLSRSWALTQGNFWRIVVIGLACWGPLLLAVGIARVVIIGPELYPGAGGNPADLASQFQMNASQIGVMLAHMPALIGLDLLVAPLLVGLTIAPALFAYRSLRPELTGSEHPF